MKRILKLSVRDAIPLVYAKIKGRRKDKRVKLVFDTGAAITQLSTMVVEEIGYSARDGLQQIFAHGPSGPLDQGYTLHLDSLEIFDIKFFSPLIATYDFNNLEAEGIDGLIGFDIIRQLHLELNGSRGELIIFDE